MSGRSPSDPGELFRRLPPIAVSDDQVADMQQRVRLLVEHQMAAGGPRRGRLVPRLRSPRARALAAASLLCFSALPLLLRVRATGETSKEARVAAAQREALAVAEAQLDRWIDEMPLIEEIDAEFGGARIAYQIAAPAIDVVILMDGGPARPDRGPTGP